MSLNPDSVGTNQRRLANFSHAGQQLELSAYEQIDDKSQRHHRLIWQKITQD
jgi:hypothetical protein